MNFLERFQKGNKTKISVEWGLNTEGKWCSLFNTDFSSLSNSGVYVIWGYNLHNVNIIIKVGKSIDLSQRISSYKYPGKDNKVIEYLDTFSNMYITWANLPKSQIEGVEVYLGKHLYHPLIADAFPSADPIPVNDPFPSKVGNYRF
jgi:hypothetical protein